MVQQIRESEPQSICIIPVDTVTRHSDEELITFGISAIRAKQQAEQLLAASYGCNSPVVTAGKN